MKTTMRAVQGKDYGPIDEMVHLVEDAPVPCLNDIPIKDRKNWAVIRTLAVALAPADVRVLSGKTRALQGPPSFPYTVGGDVCGQVVEVETDCDFKVGDVINARFYRKPMGALGQYALVNTKCCDLVPAGVSPEGAAALGSSGIAANVISKLIRQGERILVIGAGGGVGSHFCQLARHQGASYIAGLARDASRLVEKPICCDVGIDYTKEDPWTKSEFLEQPFDVVVDFAGTGWLRMLQDSKAGKKLVVKTANQGGRYLTSATDEPWFAIRGIWDALKIFMFTTLWRATYSRLTTRNLLPTYSFVMALPEERQAMRETLSLVRNKVLTPCIDPAGPFPFTTEGVRSALKLQESRHVRGKAVIHVAEFSSQ